MITIKDYKKAATLEEAWQLNQKKSARILGGMGWIKQQKKMANPAIDLSGLGLDTIEEGGAEFSIGAMVTLRQLEQDKRLNEVFSGAFREAVRHIVGVQFRNCATIGGSIWGRFGFSDPLTLLLALETEVELFTKEGLVRLPLAEFAERKYDRDVLVRLYVKKSVTNVAYLSQRNTATDFPVLAVALARCDNGWRLSIGARPNKAKLLCLPEDADLAEAAHRFSYGSNLRGSGDYRRRISVVLTKRAAKQLEQEG